MGLTLSQALARISLSSADSPIEVVEGESIQSAIDQAAAGDEIRVGPGAYNETLIVDKPLSIIAEAGPENTLIEANSQLFDFEGVPVGDFIVGAFNIVKTADVLIQGFSVTNAIEGIWVSTSQDVLVENCSAYGNVSSGYYFWASQDSKIRRSLGTKNAVGIYQGQSGNIDMEECLFINNIGGVAPHLGGEYGLEFPGLGILVGNRSNIGVIRGCKCNDNVDGGIQINFGVERMLITENEISNNPIGILMGERGPEVHRNNIFNNHNLGIEAFLEIDATENWWGDPTGPGGAGNGAGDAVTGSVQYEPWLTEPVTLPDLSNITPPASE